MSRSWRITISFFWSVCLCSATPLQATPHNPIKSVGDSLPPANFSFPTTRNSPPELTVPKGEFKIDDSNTELQEYQNNIPLLIKLFQSVNPMALDMQGRRRGSYWEMAAPALMVGGTVTALLLAALGALAGKALLSSILAAAISAIQLARPPPPANLQVG